MLRIEINNLENARDILEKYTKCSSIGHDTKSIVENLCETLDVSISDDLCYISDLLKYLLDTTTIILDIRQVDLIMVIVNNRYFDYSRAFGNYKFFRELMSTGVLPIELKNVRIDYVLNKIKENKGE